MKSRAAQLPAGVVGLAKTLAHELSQYNITVNTLHPTAVNTDITAGMAKAAAMQTADLVEFISVGHALPVKLIEATDVATAALWLASDEARYVTEDHAEKKRRMRPSRTVRT
jgi:NAD(P)-dependent dehydrogenase (short-subunit alcohol dehydrogenase family)